MIDVFMFWSILIACKRTDGQITVTRRQPRHRHRLQVRRPPLHPPPSGQGIRLPPPANGLPRRRRLAVVRRRRRYRPDIAVKFAPAREIVLTCPSASHRMALRAAIAILCPENCRFRPDRGHRMALRLASVILWPNRVDSYLRLPAAHHCEEALWA